MSPSTPTPALDHLILFLPADPSTKFPILPKFFTDNFTITPGGFHADGATSNSLIVLKDGCYIELISFICPPEQSAKHWWGPNPDFKGWKDWCLTTSDSFDANYERIKASHGEPIKGGRKRPDGQDVKWAVTFPQGEDGGQQIRGKIPFFCHDVTPRQVRVPIDDEKATHPSDTLGVRQITIVAKDQTTLDATRAQYSSIFGNDGSIQGDEIHLQAARVHDVDGLDKGPTVTLRLPKNDVEAEKTKEKGFWYGDVVLAAKAKAGKEVGKHERLDRAGDDVGGIWLEFV